MQQYSLLHHDSMISYIPLVGLFCSCAVQLRMCWSQTTAVTNFVRKLKKKGVPIDGIGAQSHLISGSLPDSMQEV
ncbi:hypothetical protein BDZ91DRAFT_718795 [Kalaharituber pfeilii]|nr:hypothetical protein BDZ91DRAFT_718795 [Kalaharituber pfeilii]